MKSTEHSIDGICIPFLTSFLPFGLVLLQKGLFFFSLSELIYVRIHFFTVFSSMFATIPVQPLNCALHFIKADLFKISMSKRSSGKKKRVSCCAGDSQAFKPWQHCWRFVRPPIFSHFGHDTRVHSPTVAPSHGCKRRQNTSSPCDRAITLQVSSAAQWSQTSTVSLCKHRSAFIAQTTSRRNRFPAPPPHGSREVVACGRRRLSPSRGKVGVHTGLRLKLPQCLLWPTMLVL